MCLRNIEPRDVEAIADLDHVCFKDGIAYSETTFYHLLSHPHSLNFLFEKNRTLVGFIIAVWEGGTGEIVTIDIDPRFRCTGKATELYHLTEVRLKEKGISTLFLHAAVENQPALRFYKKEGFRLLDMHRDYYLPGENAFHMVKHLH